MYVLWLKTQRGLQLVSLSLQRKASLLAAQDVPSKYCKLGDP